MAFLVSRNEYKYFKRISSRDLEKNDKCWNFFMYKPQGKQISSSRICPNYLMLIQGAFLSTLPINNCEERIKLNTRSTIYWLQWVWICRKNRKLWAKESISHYTKVANVPFLWNRLTFEWCPWVQYDFL